VIYTILQISGKNLAGVDLKRQTQAKKAKSYMHQGITELLIEWISYDIYNIADYHKKILLKWI
jgi:hypothetical protein